MTPVGGKSIPLKLKHDAIVEAIFEMRFQMAPIPEIFFGRIAEHSPWKSFVQRRMALYEIPGVVRQADPNLRYAPVFEMISNQKDRLVRVGPQVLSYHRLAPYVGWGKFKVELEDAIAGLFKTMDGIKVERLGLRYTNALRPDLHGIRSISDLDLRLEIAGKSISDNVNVNFTEIFGDSLCTVRVATPQFVQGPGLPSGTSVYIDVDVYTGESVRMLTQNDTRAWIEMAHDSEKQQFFSLLPPQRIEVLRER
jgi:uncharacterized protein (TIGR04255 family)